MNLAEFVKRTFVQRVTGSDFVMRPKIICADGFAMSVQGSSGHYRSPRTSQDWYNEMEIGYPSAEEADLLPFAEEAYRPTDTVYGYVPCDVIQKVIDAHGGIDIDKTFVGEYINLKP